MESNTPRYAGSPGYRRPRRAPRCAAVPCNLDSAGGPRARRGLVGGDGTLWAKDSGGVAAKPMAESHPSLRNDLRCKSPLDELCGLFVRQRKRKYVAAACNRDVL